MKEVRRAHVAGELLRDDPERLLGEHRGRAELPPAGPRGAGRCGGAGRAQPWRTPSGVTTSRLSSRQSSGRMWSRTSSTVTAPSRWPFGVDDRQLDEVVRREHPSHLPQRGLGRERLDVLVEDASYGRVRRLAQQALDVHHAQVAGRWCLERRPAHEDGAGQRGRQLPLASHHGQGLGDRGLRSEDDRLGGHQAAGGVLVVGEQAAQVGGLVGLQLPSAAPPDAPWAARRAGRRRRRAPSPRARRRHDPPRGPARISTWSSSGSSSMTSASRSSPSAAATSACWGGLRSWMTSARSAGLRSS